MRRTLLLAAGFGLSACATVPRPGAPPPRPTVATKPAPPAPAPIVRDWKDRPFSSGGWTLAQETDGMVARFGRAGSGPDFLVACNTPTRTIRFARAGSLPELMASKMTLASTEGAKSYDAANSSGQPAYIWSETRTSDPQLDLLAFSRGRFLVSIAGTDDLVIPAWPEFAHIVEECRAANEPMPTAAPQPAKSDAKIN